MGLFASFYVFSSIGLFCPNTNNIPSLFFSYPSISFHMTHIKSQSSHSGLQVWAHLKSHSFYLVISFSPIKIIFSSHVASPSPKEFLAFRHCLCWLFCDDILLTDTHQGNSVFKACLQCLFVETL